MGELENEVARHYDMDGLLDRILAVAGDGNGRGIDRRTLGRIDEFHIGGAAATERLIAQLAISPSDTVLDIGSGVGGPARHIADLTGATVTGVDLTPGYVEIATELSRLTGHDERVSFRCASALDLPFADGSFDDATILHVGMNISDKDRLMREAARVLRGGGHLAVYDIMRTGSGALDYPLPWAASDATSFLGTPGDYRASAERAGFTVERETVRRDEALAFFAEMRARIADRMSAGLPPPAGVNLVMGPDAAAKIRNVSGAIEQGRIAPVELIFRKMRPTT